MKVYWSGVKDCGESVREDCFVVKVGWSCVSVYWVGVKGRWAAVRVLSADGGYSGVQSSAAVAWR